MQRLEVRSDLDVKRGMDLVRNILLGVEADPRLDGNGEMQPHSAEEFGVESCPNNELAYHLALLIDAGYLDGYTLVNDMPVIKRMTWEGH